MYHTSDLPEIILDPDGRWWVSQLNRLGVVQRGSSLPTQVLLRDCTLREGEEMPGTHLTLEQKLALGVAIQETGLIEIEVGYCGAVDEHWQLIRLLRDAGVTAKLTSLNRTYAREGEWQAEIDRAVDAGADMISFIVFANDDLLMSVPWLPKEQVPQRVYDCISRAQTAGVQATTTLAGASRTSLRWVEQVVRAAAAAGAAVISMADSNGCAVPEAVDYLIRFVRDAVGPVPALGFHGHNTFGLATANALAAVRAGADVVDTVPLGLGEGSGITPLEELAFALEVLYGIPTGLDMSLIPCLCAHVQEVFRVEVPPTKTFLGSGLYRHSIDSHIASILRGKWYSWECVNPSLLTRRRELEFGFSKIRRGRTGAIAAKIELMGLEADDQQLDQIIAEVRAIAQEHDWATEAEVETIIGDCLRGVGAKNE